ncbi:MAG: hypothetical protein P4L99_13950 [Chthoniobacter sp.]|nr:hypothetical protein [Chthoniobacter sp.]
MKLHDEEQLRARMLGRMRGYLVRQRSPRMILSGIMLATAMAGFLASVGMLKLGLAQMWLRYPLAVLVAWGVFLLLVRQWAERERASIRVDEELARLESESESVERKSIWPDRAPETSLGRRSRWWEFLDFPDVGDAEGCLVFLVAIIIIALAIGAVMAIAGLIIEAETVLAEVLLDTVLVTAFYRRLRRKEPDWWLHGMVRQTVRPVLLTMGLLAAVGLGLHYYAPEAHSIGAAWRAWRDWGRPAGLGGP